MFQSFDEWDQLLYLQPVNQPFQLSVSNFRSALECI